MANAKPSALRRSTCKDLQHSAPKSTTAVNLSLRLVLIIVIIVMNLMIITITIIVRYFHSFDVLNHLIIAVALIDSTRKPQDTQA